MRMRYFIQFVLALLLIQGALAESIEAKDFETRDQENRYTVLIENIRCPVCQGQSIGGSNSSLASDLREQVRTMILDNKSDKDIYLFMVERYGDFVNFKPPINSKTYLLWFAPLLLLFLCFIYLYRITRSKNTYQSSSDNDVERAKKLLK
ncbi:cytochrome c-type biogenesis protein CcmH [Candidatus Thioglobus sp.]|nr:cytochrome c-type biogenesis protein CcmH [Candidatus Thioglobus sp.]